VDHDLGSTTFYTVPNADLAWNDEAKLINRKTGQEVMTRQQADQTIAELKQRGRRK
jgi:hypothetical protein